MPNIAEDHLIVRAEALQLVEQHTCTAPHAVRCKCRPDVLILEPGEIAMRDYELTNGGLTVVVHVSAPPGH